jgi:hypothetical protein
MLMKKETINMFEQHNLLIIKESKNRVRTI